MKSQLSLEFALYLAAAASGLVFALALFGRAAAAIKGGISDTEWYAFAAEIESRVGYQAAKFFAVVPQGFCSSWVNGSSIVQYGNATYALGAPLFVEGNVCAGLNVTLGMYMLPNGSYLLYRAAT
jgi:hypothetical protein